MTSQAARCDRLAAAPQRPFPGTATAVGHGRETGRDESVLASSASSYLPAVFITTIIVLQDLFNGFSHFDTEPLLNFLEALLKKAVVAQGRED